MQARTNPTTGRESWVYVPRTYSPNVAHGVLVWLHAAGKGGKDADDVAAIWRNFCEDYHFIVVGPRSKNPEGWVASEAEEVVQDVQTVLGQYTVDRARVAAHGMGDGGQMALYLGFAARDVFRGVAASGSALAAKPKDATAGQPLGFFIVAGEKDPLLKDIVEAKNELVAKKYPVVYRQLAEFGKEYLDAKTLRELENWLDGLDRI